jgi:hypothetical protein
MLRSKCSTHTLIFGFLGPHVFGHTSFEKYGFHVIGASLYFGTQVLSSQDDVSNYTCPVHAKCLGLVKWVHDPMTNFDNKRTGTTIKVSNRIRSERAFDLEKGDEGRG